MIKLLTILSMISIFALEPTTTFDTVIQHTSVEEIEILESNNITDWNGYYDYLEYNHINVGERRAGLSTNGDNSVSNAISDVERHLNEKYPEYYWLLDNSKTGSTMNVSNQIPIEMQSSKFTKSEIEEAIKIANVEGYTSYGGCGPIASMGILDYFARYLGYNEIISDASNSDKRIILATSVLTRTHFSLFGNKDQTLVWPWDNSEAFNKLMKTEGLDNIISSKDSWTLLGGQQNKYWNLIVTNIDKGLPVTLFTGLLSGTGEFAEHYTNVYGYETWTGRPISGGELLTETFIKARINGGRTQEYYCDADILNRGQTGLITYEINYENEYNILASDFSDDFVNDSGGGQYFFYNITKNVKLPNNIILETNRLRTSYIENKHLVLSPNRNNAGMAYLDIKFPHSVSSLSFDIAMWGSLEGALHEEFKIQYMESSEWKDHVLILPSSITTLRNYPDTYDVLFSKNVSRIRFVATHNQPSGDRNKGRIVLDNFVLNYN